MARSLLRIRRHDNATTVGVMGIVAMATATTTGVADIAVAVTPYPAVGADVGIGRDNVTPTGPRRFRRPGFALGINRY